jgi:inorganic pyrophosphatase
MSALHKPINLKRTIFCSLMYFILLQSCGSTKDYYTLPAQVSQESFNAVIEIPAGTNKKYEYDPNQKEFIVDIENGKERLINFLPYPANYGFIPSTLSKSDNGGDGDALDILIISEAMTIGTVLEVIPIAILKLIDDGETDYKIIAVPQDKNKRIIRATTYTELTTDYPILLEIVELWFLNYNPKDSSSVEGWGDEKEAFNEIKKHETKKRKPRKMESSIKDQ